MEVWGESVASIRVKTFYKLIVFSFFPYLCIIHWHPIGVYARLLLEAALERISNILFCVVCLFVLVFVYDSKKESQMEKIKRVNKNWKTY